MGGIMSSERSPDIRKRVEGEGFGKRDSSFKDIPRDGGDDDGDDDGTQRGGRIGGGGLGGKLDSFKRGKKSPEGQGALSESVEIQDDGSLQSDLERLWKERDELARQLEQMRAELLAGAGSGSLADTLAELERIQAERDVLKEQLKRMREELETSLAERDELADELRRMRAGQASGHSSTSNKDSEDEGGARRFTDEKTDQMTPEQTADAPRKGIQGQTIPPRDGDEEDWEYSGGDGLSESEGEDTEDALSQPSSIENGDQELEHILQELQQKFKETQGEARAEVDTLMSLLRKARVKVHQMMQQLQEQAKIHAKRNQKQREKIERIKQQRDGCVAEIEFLNQQSATFNR